MILRVLQLGAGVQSTSLYLMGMDGELQFDIAIFADTGEEPNEVYEHLEFLESLNGPPIIRVSLGQRLGDNLISGVTTGQRFVSIPTFLSIDGKTNSGIGKRQCTREYKSDVIEHEIRLRLGTEPGCRVPKGNTAVQIFGLSFDEPKRVRRVKDRFAGSGSYWHICEFPLFDDFMTRADCLAYLNRRLPGRHVPRSACVFCPFHDDAEWLRIKQDPAAWSRAVEIDRAIRLETSVCTRGMNAKQYLHRSCQPLELVQLSPTNDPQMKISFAERDCEGMCGS